MQLRVLLFRDGGREHALAWKLAQSSLVQIIFVAPGNSGTAQNNKTINLDWNFQRDGCAQALSQLLKDNAVNLVIPTQEQHLIDGITDIILNFGVRCCGPSKLAARLEGSKVWAKQFMNRHDIATGDFYLVSSFEHGSQLLQTMNFEKIVIKAIGLVSGSGVWIATLDQARDILFQMFEHEFFGPISKCGPIMLEPYLEGPEFSILAFSDGKTGITFPPFHDYKRRFSGDEGPNTGGMGCQIPVEGIQTDLLNEVKTLFVDRTLDAMSKEGYPFVGALCLDIIITRAGPKVLEYDIRLGDPETQALLSAMTAEIDLAGVLLSCTQEQLKLYASIIPTDFAVAVVVVHRDYPGTTNCSTTISIGTAPKDTNIFHGGLRSENGVLISFKGRILTVCGMGKSLEIAKSHAYQGVSKVEGENTSFRADIGSV